MGHGAKRGTRRVDRGIEASRCKRYGPAHRPHAFICHCCRRRAATALHARDHHAVYERCSTPPTPVQLVFEDWANSFWRDALLLWVLMLDRFPLTHAKCAEVVDHEAGETSSQATTHSLTTRALLPFVLLDLLPLSGPGIDLAIPYSSRRGKTPSSFTTEGALYLFRTQDTSLWAAFCAYAVSFCIEWPVLARVRRRVGYFSFF